MLKHTILALTILLKRVGYTPTGIRILSRSSLPKSLVGCVGRSTVLTYESRVD